MMNRTRPRPTKISLHLWISCIKYLQ